MTLDLGGVREAGVPRTRALELDHDLDVHALATGLGALCPALLESGGSERERWHVLPLLPRGELTARDGAVRLSWRGRPEARVEGRALDALGELLAAVSSARPERDLPFAGGVVGVLGYDLVHEIERLPCTTEDRDGWPWLHVVACPASLLVDLQERVVLLAWLPDAGGSGTMAWGLRDEEVDELARRVTEAVRVPAAAPGGGPTGPVQALTSASEYRAMVSAAQERLRAGDIYQANVSQRFEVPWTGSALGLHGILRRTNPSPMSGWLRGPEWDLVSGSPERLVRLRGRDLVSEPIAGTVRLPYGRGTPATQVAACEEVLRNSEKDRAEHVMIVDLHRNDVSRVSAPGTLRVESMLRIDRRSHVLQAVADVRGVLRDGAGPVDVIAAMFPGGCVTGIPKVRCMEILDELERWRRGPYTGSFGTITSWGDLDLNVLIRSAWRVGARLAFQAGGGVVLDSVPELEHEESCSKAAAVTEAVESMEA